MAAPKTSNLLLPLGVLGIFEFKNSYRTAMGLIDAAVGKVLTGTKTAHDFASIADGAEATTTVTVTGAELGDFVVAVSFDIDPAGLKVSGYVSAADTVTVIAANGTGAPVDLAATDIAVLVRKA